MLHDKAKFGVMATTIDVKKYCRDEAIWKFTKHANIYNCSNLLVKEKVKE